MPAQGKSFGLVIRTRDYRDKDRWITLLTAENGRQNFLAKGVRSLTSRRRAALQTGSLVNCGWVGRGETRLITEAVQEDMLLPDQTNLALMRDLSAILEIVYHISLENQNQEDLLDQVVSILRYLRAEPNEYHRGRVRQALITMLYEQGISTPEEFEHKSAAEVFESVVGRSVKSFAFLRA